MSKTLIELPTDGCSRFCCAEKTLKVDPYFSGNLILLNEKPFILLTSLELVWFESSDSYNCLSYISSLFSNKFYSLSSLIIIFFSSFCLSASIACIILLASNCLPLNSGLRPFFLSAILCYSSLKAFKKGGVWLGSNVFFPLFILSIASWAFY